MQMLAKTYMYYRLRDYSPSRVQLTWAWQYSTKTHREYFNNM